VFTALTVASFALNGKPKMTSSNILKITMGILMAGGAGLLNGWLIDVGTHYCTSAIQSDQNPPTNSTSSNVDSNENDAIRCLFSNLIPIITYYSTCMMGFDIYKEFRKQNGQR
jgi:hypothetical protein